MRPSIIICCCSTKLSKPSKLKAKRDNMRQQENVHFPTLEERFVVLGFFSSSIENGWRNRNRKYRIFPSANFHLVSFPFIFRFLIDISTLKCSSIPHIFLLLHHRHCHHPTVSLKTPPKLWIEKKKGLVKLTHERRKYRGIYVL